MCTWLRDLIKGTEGLDEKGKLIDELSIHYGLAICQNPDSFEKIKNKVYAILFFFERSSDDNP